MRTALELLRNLWLTAGSPARYEHELTQLDESYALLEQYALQGLPDPQRPRLYGELSAAVAGISARLVRESEIPENPSLYYATVRYERLQNQPLSALIEEYRNCVTKGSPRSERERLATRLFNRLWVSYPLTADEQSAIESLATDTSMPPHLMEYISSALMLGALSYPDERRLLLLGRLYNSAEHNDSRRLAPLAALIPSLVAYCRQTGSTPGRKIDEMVAALLDRQGAAADVKMVFMQLIRTRDTERVSRKIKDELMPDLMKMSGDLRDKLKDGNIDIAGDPDDPDNPLWAEAFEKTGLADKLREISELQSDGGDVMMATFANLKQFPFFNEAANWFLPFDPEHSALEEVRSSAPEFLDLIAKTSMFCDGDKYSISILAGSMKGLSAGAMLEQLRAQHGMEREELATSLSAESVNEATIANRYVQNLYRFFKLFRRKGEMPDPFIRAISPPATPLLREVYADDADGLRVAAEFYFRRGHYAEAVELFGLLEQITAPEAQLYQKMGVALNRSGERERALEMLQNAELLSGDDPWTLRRIASLLRELGRHEEALKYYSRLEELIPEDARAAAGTALSLMDLHRYDEALRKFTKAEYLLTEQRPERRNDRRLGEVVRAMARTNLWTRNIKRAAELYDRLGEMNLPTDAVSAADDALGRAITALAHNRNAEAVEQLSLLCNLTDRTTMRTRLEREQELLSRLGVDPLIAAIAADAAAHR